MVSIKKLNIRVPEGIIIWSQLNKRAECVQMNWVSYELFIVKNLYYPEAIQIGFIGSSDAQKRTLCRTRLVSSSLLLPFWHFLRQNTDTQRPLACLVPTNLAIGRKPHSK